MFVITGKILIKIKRFTLHHLLFDSNRPFMTDSHYLGTIQIWGNLSEHHYYLTSTKSVICQIDTNCSPLQSLNIITFHIRLERLKLIYYSLKSKFSKYFFKYAHLASFFVFQCIYCFRIL